MSARIILFGAVLTMLLGLHGVANAQSAISVAESAPELPVSATPLVAHAGLATNTSNTSRLYSLLAEDAGIENIGLLLVASATEEQWAYLPERSLWIEIGIDEAGSQVETDVAFLTQVLASADQVHLYHFHPAATFQPGLNATVALALPSPADVESSLKIAKIQNTVNPAADVRNFVVSPYGVVEYAPTPLGRARIVAEETHPRAFIERDLLTLVAVRRSAFNLNRMLEGATAADPDELISELCAQLTSEFYEMRLFPR